MRIILLSTFDLGRQPFGLSSPAAWLRSDGHHVTVADLSCGVLGDEVSSADLVAFHLPMHTATRLAVPVIARVRKANPAAKLCCYGLYAPMNEPYLRGLGVEFIVGGEFEQGLCDVANGVAPAALSLTRQQFVKPDRIGLPSLTNYAGLFHDGVRKTVGYTEASRGCKHLCRHCPIVPVYNGVFRVVQRDVVMADIRQQVLAGAQHITFGDPDFFNGIGHAIPLVEQLHAEFPEVTYDATIKIEHLLKHREFLRTLKTTGCLFIVSAVESVDDAVLKKLDKGHTRADFVEALRLTREAGLQVSPTFLPFTPWTTRASYRELLQCIADLDLIESTAPIQLGIRLLLPAGSRLRELEEIRQAAPEFDSEALCYRWKHADPDVDALCVAVQRVVQKTTSESRSQTFDRIWKLAFGNERRVDFHLAARVTMPYLTEPWYC